MRYNCLTCSGNSVPLMRPFSAIYVSEIIISRRTVISINYKHFYKYNKVKARQIATTK